MRRTASAQVHLTLDHVAPVRGVGVLEVGQPDPGAGVQRVDRHLAAGRPGDLDPPVAQVARRRRDLPVPGADLGGGVEEVRPLAGRDAFAAGTPRGEQLVAPDAEQPLQVRQERQRLGGEHLLGPVDGRAGDLDARHPRRLRPTGHTRNVPVRLWRQDGHGCLGSPACDHTLIIGALLLAGALTIPLPAGLRPSAPTAPRTSTEATSSISMSRRPPRSRDIQADGSRRRRSARPCGVRSDAYDDFTGLLDRRRYPTAARTTSTPASTCSLRGGRPPGRVPRRDHDRGLRALAQGVRARQPAGLRPLLQPGHTTPRPRPMTITVYTADGTEGDLGSDSGTEISRQLGRRRRRVRGTTSRHPGVLVHHLRRLTPTTDPVWRTTWTPASAGSGLATASTWSDR